MRRINKIVVHCSATKEGQHVTVEEIRRWHRARGFTDIGYHYVIYLDGTVHKGRPEWLAGAHVKGHNSNSIGICYIGGVDKDGKPKDTRTVEQKIALRILLKTLRRRFPSARILGHRDLSPDLNGNGQVDPWEWSKACPSFNAQEEYATL